MDFPPLPTAVGLITQTIPDVQGVYRFGSYGTPAQTPASDLDLAILAADPISAVACWELAQQIAIALNIDVDLIDLQTASTVFRFQIISTGNRIFCRNQPACEQFEDLVYSMYLRFNEERQPILQTIAETGEIYQPYKKHS